MKKLYVYADFDWLKEVELIGELSYELLRGADSYSFTFNNEWLRQHGDLFLSDDLNNYPGQQYTQPDKDIFGCFSDALPDRWGRTLLLRSEQLAAAEEKRSVRRLSSFDFLTGIDDFSRMGGFRFKEDPDGRLRQSIAKQPNKISPNNQTNFRQITKLSCLFHFQFISLRQSTYLF
jgi:serine/threonine-protein kinase HipA